MTDWKKLAEKALRILYEVFRDPERLRRYVLYIIGIPIAIYAIYVTVRSVLATFGIIPW